MGIVKLTKPKQEKVSAAHAPLLAKAAQMRRMTACEAIANHLAKTTPGGWTEGKYENIKSMLYASTGFSLNNLEALQKLIEG